MIDIRFLNVIPEIRLRSGMEFLDWQDKNFYTELTNFFETCVDENYLFKMDIKDRKKLADIVKKHSNISIKPIMLEYGNAGIDAGYINPYSVINTPDIEKFFPQEESKLGETLKKLKTNILKGWCDLKTGKVEGDFKKIEFNLYLSIDLPRQCKDADRYHTKEHTLYNALASIVLHEVGHAFFGLHYISSSIIDNTVCMALVKELTRNPDKNRKAVIIKQVKEITEVDLSKSLAADEFTPESVLVIFTKGLADRDQRRSLSLGVAEMTSEVLADAYCIRMGGSHGLVGFLARNKILYVKSLIPLAISIVMLFFPAFMVFGIVGLISNITLIYRGIKHQLVSGEYDTQYRRIKNILRENIAFINTNPKDFTPAELAKAKSDALELEKIIESTKSFWESTWMQRWVGHLSQGTQFRKNDFEHYTAELASSRLALYTTPPRSN